MEKENSNAAQAVRNSNIIAALGALPTTASDYVRLAARRLEASVTYKGAVKLRGLSSASQHDLERDMRILAAELRLGIPKADINDAAERYYLDMRESGLDLIRRTISVRTEFDWLGLVRECFVLDSVSAELVAAVLKHYVWQVQRKLAGRPVTDHLMPVLHGPQGGGKTYWIEKFVGPLVGVTSGADFGQIADERIIDLWRSYVIVLDEMAKAAKADIEVVKHVITADTLERRPMRCNYMVQVPQRASLIGASNHRMIELIRDETGNRRFVELFYRRPTDPDYLCKVDWFAAWGSVQAEDRCPIVDYRDELREQQEDARHRGPVEAWLEGLTDLDMRDLHRLRGSDDLISGQVLYDAYVAHRQLVTASNDREHRTLNTFSNELRRLTDSDEQAVIKKARSRHRNGWRLTSPPAELRVAA